eukprot:GHVQ01007767.1.p1 GENE.GHVQ01007767.1~~GHVQ01007767.1.p1  ORF type:complete len:454 (-),score=121.32 GHVQ01007767.1:635-1996(-)
MSPQTVILLLSSFSFPPVFLSSLILRLLVSISLTFHFSSSFTLPFAFSLPADSSITPYHSTYSSPPHYQSYSPPPHKLTSSSHPSPPLPPIPLPPSPHIHSSDIPPPPLRGGPFRALGTLPSSANPLTPLSPSLPHVAPQPPRHTSPLLSHIVPPPLPHFSPHSSVIPPGTETHSSMSQLTVDDSSVCLHWSLSNLVATALTTALCFSSPSVSSLISTALLSVQTPVYNHIPLSSSVVHPVGLNSDSSYYYPFSFSPSSSEPNSLSSAYRNTQRIATTAAIATAADVLSLSSPSFSSSYSHSDVIRHRHVGPPPQSIQYSQTGGHLLSYTASSLLSLPSASSVSYSSASSASAYSHKTISANRYYRLLSAIPSSACLAASAGYITSAVLQTHQCIWSDPYATTCDTLLSGVSLLANLFGPVASSVSSILSVLNESIKCSIPGCDVVQLLYEGC